MTKDPGEAGPETRGNAGSQQPGREPGGVTEGHTAEAPAARVTNQWVSCERSWRLRGPRPSLFRGHGRGRSLLQAPERPNGRMGLFFQCKFKNLFSSIVDTQHYMCFRRAARWSRVYVTHAVIPHKSRAGVGLLILSPSLPARPAGRLFPRCLQQVLTGSSCGAPACFCAEMRCCIRRFIYSFTQ